MYFVVFSCSPDTVGTLTYWSVWHAWQKREIYTDFWWGNLTERSRLGYLDVDGIKMLNG
jgi:hypothetical protein